MGQIAPIPYCPICARPVLLEKADRRAGSGSQRIPFKKLTVDHLHEAIEIGVYDSRIQQNASELGIRIRGENGVQVAIHLKVFFV